MAKALRGGSRRWRTNAYVTSLGMYDHPAKRAANGSLWSALAAILRHDGIDATVKLDRTRPVEAIWRDPAQSSAARWLAILLSTCGRGL